MQRINLKMKMWQTLLSMFLASMAALLISAAPAYADDEVIEGEESATPIVQVVDDTGAAQATASSEVVAPAATEPAAVEPAAAEPVTVVEPAAAAAPAAAPAATAAPAAAAPAVAPAATVEPAAAPASEPAAEAAAPEALSKTEAEGAQANVAAESGVFAITESGSYTLSGEGVVPVTISGKIQVVLDLISANINAIGTGHSAISVTGGAQAIFNVIGSCSFTGDVNQAGIQVDKDSAVTINGTDSPSSITAVGNGGVDYSSTSEANEANWTSGAGIGGTATSVDSGAIAINGNDKNLTVSAIGGGKGASGIGSTYSGSSSTITIVDTVLDGVHGGCNNAAIEGAAEYAKSTLEGGAGIGGGTKATSGGEIVISGCTGTDIVGGGKSAGIGGGCWATSVSVSIIDSDLQVEGGTTGAAIGTGRAFENVALDVFIGDSTIVARGGYLGAGIGLGVNGSNRQLDLADVIISNSDVTAIGGAGAAGIGGGARGYNVNVGIADGSNVLAYAGANYMAKYTERYNGAADSITEDGGIGQSGAAAIGRGAWGSMNFTATEQEQGPKLVISDDSTVVAMSSGDNWAIAGFTNMDGVAANVLQTRFLRNYDLAGNEFITRTADEAIGGDWVVCFLDGVQSTTLAISRTDDNTVVATVTTPDLGTAYANGYEGEGRVGYYSIATTIPEAGSYKISTDSGVRSMTRLGDELLSAGDDGYLGGATYWGDSDRSGVFDVSAGVNSFDKMAFRTEAAPAPDPETPEPETPEPGTPDPETPDNPPIVPQTDDPTPVVPDPDDPTPPAPVPAPAPPAPAPAPAAGVPVGDAGVPLGAPAPDAAPAAEAIADDETPLAGAETIADDETPLAGVFEEEEDCWVHWWIMLGILLTCVYSSVVVARRGKHSHDVFNIDKGVMTGEDYEQERVNVPLPNMGAQPAMSASSEA